MKTMNKTHVYRAVKYVFCLAMAGADLSELLQSAVVLNSLIAIGVPQRLLFLLAPLKLAGVLCLLVAPNPRLVEWAYAGFFFNLLGALYLLITARESSLPDQIIDAVYLLLWLCAYWSYRSIQLTTAETPQLSSRVA